MSRKAESAGVSFILPLIVGGDFRPSFRAQHLFKILRALLKIENLEKSVKFCERVREVVFNQTSARTNNNARNRRN